MDYLEIAAIARAPSWNAFRQANTSARLVLLTTRASQSYLDFAFSKDDILLLGRESSGVAEAIHTEVSQRICIPMQQGARSLNVALACAMVTGEALRQLRGQG
jgi:tRNA (cytidine/uridine-2'-O-)-methyltransferase